MKKRERSYKPREEETKESRQQRISRIFITIITVLSAALLILTAISAFIEPTEDSLHPILAPVAPAIYIFNVILSLYWVVKWRLKIAIPTLVILVLMLGFVSLYLQIPITKDYNTKSYRGMVKMMSYNVRGFIGKDEMNSADQVAKFVETERPDIIAFQEYVSKFDSAAKEYAPSLSRYHRADHNDMVVLSRYPIIRSEALFDEESVPSTTSIIVDILISGDTIRVFNNHLQSTTIKADDQKYLTTSRIMRDSARHSVIKDIFARYRNSCVLRAKQVATITKHIEESPYPTIVCGDFNDPPASYTYTKMSNGLTDAFQHCGSDYSYTYQGFFNTLRIDYILTSREIRPESYKVAKEVDMSDHLPVVAHLKIKTKE